MNTSSVEPRVEYAYSYQQDQSPLNDESFTLKLHCPSFSSFSWCLKLYSLVLGGLGVLLSLVWVIFHMYVLSQTGLQELKQLR